MEILSYSADNYADLHQYGYYYQNVFDRSFTSVEHSHDFFEVMYLLNGKCIQCINGVNTEFSKGEIILMQPGDSHFFKEQSEDAVLISISVKAEEFSKFTSIYSTFPSLLKAADFPIKISIDKREKSFIDSITVAINTVTEQEKRNDLIKIQLSFYIQLFILKANIISNVNINVKKQHKLDLLMLQMSDSENIREGVDAMVRITNYSRPHLYRLFKEYYNTTPKQYAKTLQMDYAYQLVANSKLPFEQISEKIGYSSTSHFQKTFKETFGKTASAVRKASAGNTV